MDVYVPLKIKLMVRNAIENFEWIEKDVDIEKGDSETLRYASFLCKLKKQINFDMGGKCMQFLMNHSLPKFSTGGKTEAGKVLEAPKTRNYNYKHIGSFNPRKVALLCSALSSLGAIVLICLTLRVKQIGDVSADFA
ncbi:hypothetical protein CTI12_AA318100 [Artemisia annua]|uniref:Uncharacterized protein n=1 Tax=Artemisia annua TaxID=35608 RepID=A0A2U1N295_ARTAN|nr:hypothetical protein CTI12_AA318100 [Artemisia annua]